MSYVDALELIHDHLISKRINGVMFESPRNDAVVIVNRNVKDFPVILAWISSAQNGWVKVKSPILKSYWDSVRLFHDNQNKKINLADPDGLDQLIKVLELIAKRYNKLAILMDTFGSDLIGQAEVHVRLAPYQMYRPYPNFPGEKREMTDAEVKAWQAGHGVII